jgi:hypothetical protein
VRLPIISRCERQLTEEQETGVPLHFDCKAGLDEGQEAYDDDGEEREVPRVHEMSTCEQRSLNSGQPSLREEERSNHHDERGADDPTPRGCETVREVTSVT